MKRNVNTFFHIFQNSFLPSASYYHKVIKTKLSFSLRYFIALIVIINVLFALLVAIRVNPWTIHAIITGLQKSLSSYPNDLVIEIRNQTLQSNYDRPYFLWLDYHDKRRLVLVMDESASPDKINEYNSFILLTKNEIVFRDINVRKQYDIMSYRSVNNVVIDKNLMNNVAQTFLRINTMFGLLYPLGVAIALIFLTIAAFISTLIYIIIVSGVVFLFYLFFHKKIKPTFPKIFQITLHALTLPLVINYLLVGFNLHFNSLPNLFLFLVIIFTVVGVKEAYSLSPSLHQSHKKS